jgi:hypothetical protein
LKIRIKLAFGNYRVGDVIEPPAMLRNNLILRGFAEVVKDAPVETAEARSVETAVVRKRQRRGE